MNDSIFEVISKYGLAYVKCQGHNTGRPAIITGIFGVNEAEGYIFDSSYNKYEFSIGINYPRGFTLINGGIYLWEDHSAEYPVTVAQHVGVQDEKMLIKIHGLNVPYLDAIKLARKHPGSVIYTADDKRAHPTEDTIIYKIVR